MWNIRRIFGLVWGATCAGTPYESGLLASMHQGALHNMSPGAALAQQQWQQAGAGILRFSAAAMVQKAVVRED